MNIKIESFTERDNEEVLRLLSEAELPTEDLTTDKFQDFLVARQKEDAIIGVIGVELKQDVGLLRSLAVHPRHRKAGLGKSLTKKLESYAREKGVEALYLLTDSAVDFCLGLGYRVISRDAAPKDISDTEEFKSICPSSSICLYKEILI